MSLATRRMASLERQGDNFTFGDFTLMRLDPDVPLGKQRTFPGGFRLAKRREASSFFSDSGMLELRRQSGNQLEVIIFDSESGNCFTLRSVWEDFLDVIVKNGHPADGYYALCVSTSPGTIH